MDFSAKIKEFRSMKCVCPGWDHVIYPSIDEARCADGGALSRPSMEVPSANGAIHIALWVH